MREKTMTRRRAQQQNNDSERGKNDTTGAEDGTLCDGTDKWEVSYNLKLFLSFEWNFSSNLVEFEDNVSWLTTSILSHKLNEENSEYMHLFFHFYTWIMKTLKNQKNLFWNALSVNSEELLGLHGCKNSFWNSWSLIIWRKKERIAHKSVDNFQNALTICLQPTLTLKERDRIHAECKNQLLQCVECFKQFLLVTVKLEMIFFPTLTKKHPSLSLVALECWGKEKPVQGNSFSK